MGFVNNKREIAPFLSIYRLQETSLSSIIERVSGVFIVFVFFFGLTVKKMGAVFGSDYFYNWLINLLYFNENFGVLRYTILYFIILNCCYHLIFGCRFLYWDRIGGSQGLHIGLKEVNLTNVYCFLGSLILAFVIFLFI